jgi:DNA polymerase III psi subunit
MNTEAIKNIFNEEIYSIKNKLLIVTQEPWENLGTKERELLAKIIGALKLSLDSVQIISQPDFKASDFEGQSRSILNFGDTSVKYPNYEPQTTGNSTFICAESLTHLLSDDGAKKQLWGAMKKAFLD